MKHCRIIVDYPITEQIMEDLQSNLAFVSKSVNNVVVDRNANVIDFSVGDESAEDGITLKIKEMLSKLKPVRNTSISVLYNNELISPPYSGDVYQELVDSGNVFRHSPGIFSFTGFFLHLYNILNNRVMKFAEKEKATEIVLPVTTSLKDLHDAKFFEKTPQFANMISTLKEDSDSISEFMAEIKNSVTDVNFQRYLNKPEHMCRSAICLSSYPQFAGRVLEKNDYFCLTAFGKSFRNESSNVTSLERLHEFSMREIIYFGDPEYVGQKLQNCFEWFKSLMKDLRLSGSLQTANDPFFAENFHTLQFYQIAQQSKIEARLFNPFSKNRISIGSINNHGNHFSKSYNIRLENGEFATTGCVGFGYERTIFLILSQYGLDSTKWPEELKHFFS